MCLQEHQAISDWLRQDKSNAPLLPCDSRIPKMAGCEGTMWMFWMETGWFFRRSSLWQSGSHSGSECLDRWTRERFRKMAVHQWSNIRWLNIRCCIILHFRKVFRHMHILLCTFYYWILNKLEIIHTMDRKSVTPVFFTIGFHSKHIMQKLLCWFPY